MRDIKNLGVLQGELLVFGGPYSNLQALEALKVVAEEKGISSDRIICTGDILGYCAQPNEAIEFIRDWGIYGIAGNVELQVRNDEDACGCNFEEGSRCDLFSKSWYPYVQQTIKQVNKEWLYELPEFAAFEYAGKAVFVLHGGLTDTSQFVFKSTPWDTKKEIIEEVNEDVVIAGHCGLPFNSTQNGKHWLNPGVIGMPANDGTARVWYMTLNDEDGVFSFEHHALEYDYQKAAELMKEKQLPASYAETLSNGIWDNMEILNEEERQKQGVRIDF